jgi:pterin-4a-carbinolamine dehydratase
MTEPLVFVSYRRSDTSPYALALKAELEHRLKSAFVFVDIKRVQATERWPEVLDGALGRARVLVTMIGPRWIECEECAERPRLFDAADWVRKEIAYFLRTNSLAILPVLVDGARMPAAAELPPDIAEISEIQAVRLDPTHWNECIDRICKTLADRFDFELLKTAALNPGKSAFRRLTPPLDETTLARALKEFLAGWQVEPRFDRTEYGAMTQWLVKTYNFPSFKSAIQFMQDGASACDSLDHHPTWENCYKQVVVNLTTWNAGHRITQFDVELARRLDKIALGISSPKSGL